MAPAPPPAAWRCGREQQYHRAHHRRVAPGSLDGAGAASPWMLRCPRGDALREESTSEMPTLKVGRWTSDGLGSVRSIVPRTLIFLFLALASPVVSPVRLSLLGG